MKDHSAGKILLILFVLTLLALLIHGYHPGVEDDGVYLSAIKRDLNPNLYPRDFEFFTCNAERLNIGGSARIRNECMNARTMKPKTATRSINVSRDSLVSPPMSMAYPEGVIACENTRELL